MREIKAVKLARIRPLLRPDVPCVETEDHFDCLTSDLRSAYGLVDTENVSAHQYDAFAQALIGRGGLILDCGSGYRPHYYEDVVNFEIVPYPTTDVLGVGEDLPFLDGSFDAVFSLNVLEHVKDPFKCAAEIARVMKSGAKLYCVAPFLQPFHAYPHHYYNMTAAGLKNLFDRYLTIDKQDVVPSGLPLWCLTWFLSSWAGGLEGEVKRKFLAMTVADLLERPERFLGEPFVSGLSPDKNFEIACTTALWATKPRG